MINNFRQVCIDELMQYCDFSDQKLKHSYRKIIDDFIAHRYMMAHEDTIQAIRSFASKASC